MTVTYRERVLKNGLRIVAEVGAGAHSSGVGFFVRTGARDEPKDLMGVSHFLEHMMFKGTDTLNADEINRAFDDLGATNNAYTSREMTCFYAHTLPDGLERATDLLGAMMRPALRDADFTTEKQVILEEIAMYADVPFWVLYEQALERRYGHRPLGHRVLGTNETIGAMTRDGMLGYFAERYSPDQTVVALAGNLEFDRFADRIEALCAGWAPTGARRDGDAGARAGGRFEIADEKVSRGYLIGVSDAPSISDPRRHAATLLAQILGGGDNARLHWALIETGIAEEAQSSYEGMDGHGEFVVFASGDPEKLAEIESILLDQVRGLRDSLDEDDLSKLRAKAVTALTLASERPSGRMMRLGRVWTTLGRYTTLDEELELLSRVTVRDLRELADAFPIDNCLLGVMRPA